MKRCCSIGFSGLWLLASLCLPASCKTPGQALVLTNPGNFERPDEPVLIKRAMVEKITGPVARGKFVHAHVNGQPIFVQHDDLDQDGNWDELAMLLSFTPGGKFHLSLSTADNPAAVKMPVRAHARHRRKNAGDSFGADLAVDSIPGGLPATDFSRQPLPPFLTEGPAWENDRVGFRLYFDGRNGKDIWGKTTPGMVLDTVGSSIGSDYHKQANWGMDVLKVGPSLGAGALAFRIPLGGGKDSLVRLGGKNLDKMVYRKLADGPVRAVFSIHYRNWKLREDLPPMQVEETISIWGGQYYYESSVQTSNAPAEARLVTGLVNLHQTESRSAEGEGTSTLFTWSRQSENKDNLGMALMLPSRQLEKFETANGVHSDIRNSYIAVMKSNADTPQVFRFYAGWEKSSPDFGTAEGFRQYLETEAKRFSNPIQIK